MSTIRFLFSLRNHNDLGKISLQDVIMILMAQLRALGHEAHYYNEGFCAGRDEINVLVEGFTPAWTDLLRAAKQEKGARFIVIATEEPTEKGFNHGLSHEMVERQRIFPEVAKFFTAIWALIPGTEKWYAQYAPATYVELGYAPSLVRPQYNQPDHEFAFFGSVSKRRMAMFNRIKRRAMLATPRLIKVVQFVEQAHRDREMQRGKLVLQIRAHDAMGLVSNSRLNTSLHLGRAVVAEPHEYSSPWDQIVHFSKSEDAFISDAVALRGVWQGLHAKQMRTFAGMLSPEKCVGAALRETDIAALKAHAA